MGRSFTFRNVFRKESLRWSLKRLNYRTSVWVATEMVADVKKCYQKENTCALLAKKKSIQPVEKEVVYRPVVEIIMSETQP